MSVHLLVVGVIRTGSDVLLVRQGSPAGPGTAWALPGGRVEPTELAVEALAREIREETGLTIDGEPRLVCVGQLVNPTAIRRDAWEIPPPGGSALVLAYEIPAFRGTPQTFGDPDGDVTEVAWQPREVAAALLAAHPFPFVRTVARDAVLQDEEERNPTAQCYFRRNDNGEDLPIVFWAG